MLGSLFVGFLIGVISGSLMQQQRGGCLSTAFVGLIGSLVGQTLFGDWGPTLLGIAPVPSILGAIIVIAIFSNFLRGR